jgi:hypothetical protein
VSVLVLPLLPRTWQSVTLSPGGMVVGGEVVDVVVTGAEVVDVVVTGAEVVDVVVTGAEVVDVVVTGAEVVDVVVTGAEVVDVVVTGAEVVDVVVTGGAVVVVVVVVVVGPARTLLDNNTTIPATRSAAKPFLLTGRPPHSAAHAGTARVRSTRL